ncbi:MAG: CRTAC1 family protein [Sandaracinaceae bacterium]|nr:CRTAC1 family protein [Sandaracinaceae bacterium]
MRVTSSLILASSSTLVLLSGCPETPVDPCAGVTCATGSTCEMGTCVVTPVCNPTQPRWAPGTLAFTEETSAWGLDGVEGVRLSAIDYDADGWTDLFVRRGSGADDYGAMRSIWLMRNRGDGTFEDVTEASGIVARRSGDPGGRPVDVHAWGDVDNDGDLDVYLGVSTVDLTMTGGETSEIMLQNADHTFSHIDEASEVRLAGLTDSVAGASFVDYDLDGDLDLWTPHHGYANSSGNFVFRPAHFYQNEGGALFVERTSDVGLTTRGWSNLDDINNALAHARAWSANACDLNDDGLPELLAASYGRAPNHLWRATGAAGAVSFENASVASGYAYDDDLVWQDDQFARCYCAANPMAEDCAGVPPSMLDCSSINWDHDTGRQPFRLGGNSGATMCGDVDNDGDIDLLTSEIAHWWAGQGSDHAELMVNTGVSEIVFDRPGRDSMGIAIPHDDPGGWNEGIMTGAIFDFDADGWADLYFGMSDYPGNHGVLFHQDSALQFTEVPREEGIDHHRSHGIAVADFDRDGDLDVVVGHSRARCGTPDDCYPTMQVRLFENQLGANFVSLRLEGTTANRSAIGARVTVSAGGVTQTHDVEGGHGHYGAQDDLVQHFGLGTACEAEVTIRWPNSTLETQSVHLVAGHRYRVVQGMPPALDDPPAPSVMP